MSAAFAAHTRGSWLAAKRDADGVLTAGAPATFAVWDLGDSGGSGLSDGSDGSGGSGGSGGWLPSPEQLAAGTPTCRRTVVRGRTIHAAP
jgi:predicted amidohydrolase YtcJ